jgi:hypothetical protein
MDMDRNNPPLDAKANIEGGMSMPLEKVNQVNAAQSDPETRLENDHFKENKLTDGQDQQPPTVAPGMNTHDLLEEKASAGAPSTSVTRLFLDRTPND